MQLAAVIRKRSIFYGFEMITLRQRIPLCPGCGVQFYPPRGNPSLLAISLEPMINTPRYEITEIKSATAVIREASSNFSSFFPLLSLLSLFPFSSSSFLPFFLLV